MALARGQGLAVLPTPKGRARLETRPCAITGTAPLGRLLVRAHWWPDQRLPARDVAGASTSTHASAALGAARTGWLFRTRCMRLPVPYEAPLNWQRRRLAGGDDSQCLRHHARRRGHGSGQHPHQGEMPQATMATGRTAGAEYRGHPAAHHQASRDGEGAADHHHGDIGIKTDARLDADEYPCVPAVRPGSCSISLRGENMVIIEPMSRAAPSCRLRLKGFRWLPQRARKRINPDRRACAAAGAGATVQPRRRQAEDQERAAAPGAGGAPMVCSPLARLAAGATAHPRPRCSSTRARRPANRNGQVMVGDEAREVPSRCSNTARWR